MVVVMHVETIHEVCGAVWVPRGKYNGGQADVCWRGRGEGGQLEPRYRESLYKNQARQGTRENAQSNLEIVGTRSVDPPCRWLLSPLYINHSGSNELGQPLLPQIRELHAGVFFPS